MSSPGTSNCRNISESQLCFEAVYLINAMFLTWIKNEIYIIFTILNITNFIGSGILSLKIRIKQFLIPSTCETNDYVMSYGMIALKKEEIIQMSLNFSG